MPKLSFFVCHFCFSHLDFGLDLTFELCHLSFLGDRFHISKEVFYNFYA